MGVTKTEIFTEEQNSIANMAKVLAHPARVAILEELLKLNSCVCGELVTEIGLAQATISQHLKELKTIGLIKGTVEGTSMCYCINEEKWNEIKNQFSTFFGMYDSNKNKCC